MISKLKGRGSLFLVGGISVVLQFIPVVIYYYLDTDFNSVIMLLASYALLNSVLIGGYIWRQLHTYSDPIRNGNNRKRNALSNESIQFFYKLDEWLKREKIYLDPNLKVKKVAQYLHVTEKLVSSSINDMAKENFNSYINSLRIAEAKRMMMSQDKQHFTIDAIAELAGFSNKVSFYSAFKKETGLSPREFRKSMLSSH